MPVKSDAYLRNFYGSNRTTVSNATPHKMTLEIIGSDEMVFGLQGFSIPLLSPSGAIEVPMPWGCAYLQPGPIKTDFRQTITLIECKSGTLEKFTSAFVNKGRSFKANVHQSAPDNFGSKAELLCCLFLSWHLDDEIFPLRAFAGTLHFNYVG